MKYINKLTILLLYIGYSAQLFAIGTFGVEDLMPILEQDKEIKLLINKTFDLADSGWAERIGQRVNPKFGGRRISPYNIKAKLKGSKGDFTYNLIIHTEHIFLDKNGKETVLEKAVIIKEKFKSIEIKIIKK